MTTTADVTPWWETASMSALLRAAFRAYGDVVRAAVAEAGFDDLPRNGAYVLGATANRALTMQQLPQALGVSKQAFSQLVDSLVTRGYVERTPDPDDRRRLLLVLTGRGEAAADLIAVCAARSDAALRKTVAADDVETVRRVLAAMTAIPSDIGLR